jgi:nitrogen fixation/metabolism regulation signal transduction histidine kinase
MNGRSRTIFAAVCTTIASLALAAPAFAASDDGQGLVGETDDKIVTFVSLGVLLFFVLVIVVGSAIQGALERRKEAKKQARLQQRVGW